MILLDSNLFVYLSTRTLTGASLGKNIPAHASVTRIESLGYDNLSVAEASYLRNLFARSIELDLTKPIADRAIELRQQKRMSLGDAIIAATALEHNLELWTANEKDFATITELKIHNPVKTP